MRETAMNAQGDYWVRIGRDERLKNVRHKLSMDELRMLFQHARDALSEAPRPAGNVVKLVANAVPYSSVVGGGLTLTELNGKAAFIVNFIGTTQGITKEEIAALTAQFTWFAQTYGLTVPIRPSEPSP